MINSIKEGVEILLKQGLVSDVPTWEYLKKTNDDLSDHLVINGKVYPFFSWRFDPQVEAIARNAKNNIGGSCSAKISGLIDKDYGLEAFMYKEIDTSCWILDSSIKSIGAFYNKNAINMILKMENNKVANVELGASLPRGAKEQTRHSTYGKNGMESTRVVSTKVRPEGIYFYKDSSDPITFNDTSIELLGLSREEVIICAGIYKILAGKYDINNFVKQDLRLKEYIKLAFKASETSSKIDL